MGARSLVLLGVWVLAWAEPASIVGTWQGTLAAGAAKLRLGLHVSKTAAGDYTSSLDSIDQGAMGIPVAVTKFSGGALHIELPNLHATFDGMLSNDGQEIEGTFTQGASLPLTFKRVEKIDALDRPQTPQPPFPYESLDVSYENKAGGVTLAGTLTLPRGAGPFPAAVMITGSGPQDRDETILGHRPFLVIADYLTRRGIAVLRVDDRGVGGSTGNSLRATIHDMAGDVLAGVQFLKGRKDIDTKHIGLIGHSEGGLIAPLAASRSADVAFAVMLAGPGVNLEQVLYKQGELIRRAAGANDEAVALGRSIQEMMIGILKSEPDEKRAAEKIRAGWAKIKAAAPEEEREQLDAADATLSAQIAQFNSPEIRSMLTYDPAETLRKLRIPVLALNGSRDLQVPPQQNLPPIVAALGEGGDSDFAAVELPGLNHLFQKCKLCTVAEYATIPETFSPAALEVLAEWLARHAP
jgi:uncharacterized protein